MTWAQMPRVDRVKLSEKVERTVKRATSYVKSAESHLDWGAHIGRPVDHGFRDLLDATLDLALRIVETLPDDYFDEVESGNWFGLGSSRYNLSDDLLERVQKLSNALEARRSAGDRRARIAKLENVQGRTEIEAAAFRAKAAELRDAS